MLAKQLLSKHELAVVIWFPTNGG